LDLGLLNLIHFLIESVVGVLFAKVAICSQYNKVISIALNVMTERSNSGGNRTNVHSKSGLLVFGLLPNLSVILSHWQIRLHMARNPRFHYAQTPQLHTPNRAKGKALIHNYSVSCLTSTSSLKVLKGLLNHQNQSEGRKKQRAEKDQHNKKKSMNEIQFIQTYSSENDRRSFFVCLFFYFFLRFASRSHIKHKVAQRFLIPYIHTHTHFFAFKKPE